MTSSLSRWVDRGPTKGRLLASVDYRVPLLRNRVEPSKACRWRRNWSYDWMDAYYINLDRQPQRRAHIEATLTFASLTAYRIPGVEGLNVPPHLRSYFFNAAGIQPSRLSAGEIGCYASHMLAWQRIAEGNKPYALVVEDDAVFTYKIKEQVLAALAEAPSDWDIIHLCTPGGRAVKPVGAQLVRYSRVPMNGTGYVVSQSGAQKLVTPMVRAYPVDTDLRRPWLFRLNIYGIVPAPVEALPHFGSDIPVRSRRRRGLRPNPLHTPQGLLWNIQKLGFAWWLRCLCHNAGRRAVRDLSPWRVLRKAWLGALSVKLTFERS